MKFWTLIVMTVAASALAEEIVKTIPGSGSWRAAQVRDHKWNGLEGCIAYTTKGKLRLEVYAEKKENGYT